jgi:hypothetical protein
VIEQFNHGDIVTGRCFSQRDPVIHYARDAILFVTFVPNIFQIFRSLNCDASFVVFNTPPPIIRFQNDERVME